MAIWLAHAFGTRLFYLSLISGLNDGAVTLMAQVNWWIMGEGHFPAPPPPPLSKKMMRFFHRETLWSFKVRICVCVFVVVSSRVEDPTPPFLLVSSKWAIESTLTPPPPPPPSESAVVYWIEPLTLDQRVAGSIPVNAWHFCPSAIHFIHIAALHPGV